MEKWKEYLPYVVVAALVVIGVVLYRSGFGSSSGIGYATVPPPDNSAQVAAASQLQQSQLGAGLSGFNSIISYVDNSAARDNALARQIETDNTALAIKSADTQTQLANIRASENVANHQANTQAVASIASLATAFVLFCYKSTYTAQSRRRVYTHGHAVERFVS
jgi:hypothetical protein